VENPYRVDGSVEFEPTWFLRNGGVPSPNAMEADFGYQAEVEAGRRRMIHARFPDLGLVDLNAEVIPAFEWPYTELLVCCAYGAPPPRWVPDNGHWWHDRDFWPWQDIQSVSDVERIRVPRWEDVPEMQRIFRRLEDASDAFPGHRLTTARWTWTHPVSGTKYAFSHFISFIDLGPFMMGTVPFFTLLAGDPEVADALLLKGLEVTTGVSNYQHQYWGHPPVVGGSVVGNFGTFMSPRTFLRYSLAADLMVLDRYGGRQLPCNLHSCGPSAHLYDYWSRYPNIPLMQTRGIPGQTARLRAAMPNTYLHITLHPPQLEWEIGSPEELRAAVWEHAEAAGFRDVQLHLIVTGYGGAQAEANLRVFRQVIADVNAHLGQKDYSFIHGYGV
jgi:hypothetical protein